MQSDSAAAQALYDAVPYPPLFHPHTHPDRLAVTGRLLGLQGAGPEACRVLELGCGDGANLIAMADLLPGSRFLGIDISGRQVEEGRQIVADLGLKNVDLQQADLLDLPDAFGEFDYVIAHGLYSWVAETVRRKVLSLIRHSLAPRGIAYVSYNTYPGWYPMLAVREIMRYRSRGTDDPIERARAARNFLEFLARSFAPEAGLFGDFVRQYAGTFLGRQGAPEDQVLSSLTHDELSAINEPLYFHEFAAQAGAADLQYLAEVDLSGSTAVGLRPGVSDALSSFSNDLIETEQNLDFLRNRGFRRTLLCRPDVTVVRSLRPSPATFAGFSLASSARPARRNTGPTARVRFVARNGLVFETEHALTRAALSYLARDYPRAVLFEELLERAADAAGALKPGDANSVVLDLLQAFLVGPGLLELYVAPRPVAASVSRRPVAPPFARFLAAQGLASVPNVRHEPVGLGPLGTALLPLLDGEHALAAFESSLAAPVADLRSELRWLRRAGLLVG